MEQTILGQVSVKRLDANYDWIKIDPLKIRRSVRLSENPEIAVIVLVDGHVVPVTATSAAEAGLI